MVEIHCQAEERVLGVWQHWHLPAVALHKTRRAHCKKYGSNAMCPHNRRRSECKCKEPECGGSGICGRNKRMPQSQECGGMPSASTVRKSSCAHVRSSRSYVSSQKKHVKLSCKYYRCQLDLCQGSRWLASVVMTRDAVLTERRRATLPSSRAELAVFRGCRAALGTSMRRWGCAGRS